MFSLYYSQLLSIEILDFNVINKLVNILLCFKVHLSWLFNFTLAACPLFIHCKTGNLPILNPRFTRLVKKTIFSHKRKILKPNMIRLMSNDSRFRALNIKVKT